MKKIRPNPHGVHFIIFMIVWAAVSMSLTGCSTPGGTSQQPVPPPLNVAPDLVRFDRFELTPQSVQSAEAILRHEGTLIFQPSAAAFEVLSPMRQSAGRLFVQPEACRDDVSADCQRRFVITGHIDLVAASVNCYISVRNDTGLGYTGQALSGICQDRHARLFSLTLFGH